MRWGFSVYRRLWAHARGRQQSLRLILGWCINCLWFFIYCIRASSKTAHGNTLHKPSMWHYMAHDTFMDRVSPGTLTFDSIYLSFILYDIVSTILYCGNTKKVKSSTSGKSVGFFFWKRLFCCCRCSSSTPYELVFNKKIPYTIPNFWYHFIPQLH